MTVIGFDGDDTLWQSEMHFEATTDRFADLLAPWVPDTAAARQRLIDVERRNLELLGYGVKAFALSMIETAIEVSGSRVPASAIHEIVGWAKELMRHPVELLADVEEVVAALAARHTLLLVTKGDLLHQESKVAGSGLAEHFDGIHIVSEKDEATYRQVLAAHDVAPGDFVMVGNSLRSDILPVLGIGGRAVHVPHELLWDIEHVDPGLVPEGLPRIDRLGGLPPVLEAMSTTVGPPGADGP
jgi:putative hydrolase of the HAD superfamily